MLRNVSTLLGESFQSHRHDIGRKLYDRAERQWMTVIGSLTISGIDGLVLVGNLRSGGPLPVTIGAAVVEGLCLVGVGVGIGGLNETGREYNERLGAAQPVVAEVAA